MEISRRLSPCMLEATWHNLIAKVTMCWYIRRGFSWGGWVTNWDAAEEMYKEQIIIFLYNLSFVLYWRWRSLFHYRKICWLTSMCMFDFQVAIYFVYLAIGAGIAALLRKSRMLPILSCTVSCFFFLWYFLYMVIVHWVNWPCGDNTHTHTHKCVHDKWVIFISKQQNMQSVQESFKCMVECFTRANIMCIESL